MRGRNALQGHESRVVRPPCYQKLCANLCRAGLIIAAVSRSSCAATAGECWLGSTGSSLHSRDRLEQSCCSKAHASPIGIG